MRLLISGCGGFIGSHVCEMLIDKSEVEVLVGMDSLTYAGNKINMASVMDHEKFFFEESDICDEMAVKDVFDLHGITHVLHLAAETHVDRSIENPTDFIMTNVVGTYILLEQARESWKGKFEGKRFHVVSTDEVYGSIEKGSWTEESPFKPNSPYAASKASADLLAMSYHRTYGLPVTISHSSNNYGPRQHPEKLIPKAILNTLKGIPVPVYGKGDNERDWIWVGDHVNALWSVLKNGSLGERYNIGNGEPITNLELLHRIFTRMIGGTIEFVPDRLGHDLRYCVDGKKVPWSLSDDNSFPQWTKLNEGLDKTIDWYRDNQAWVDAVLSKA